MILEDNKDKEKVEGMKERGIKGNQIISTLNSQRSEEIETMKGKLLGESEDSLSCKKAKSSTKMIR